MTSKDRRHEPCPNCGHNFHEHEYESEGGGCLDPECTCPVACPPPPPKFYCVAIMLTDRQYGGPEEGGWYYNSYEPVDEYAYKTRCFATEDEAYKYRDDLRTFIENRGLNRGRCPVHSVLSEGEYTTYIFEGEYPKYKPDERPYYE